jgi:hypothetical protein
VGDSCPERSIILDGGKENVYQIFGKILASARLHKAKEPPSLAALIVLEKEL